MAKAMLIIEKPKCCAECPMLYKDSDGFSLCYVKRTPYVIEDESMVQKWCPLREVPQKKERDFSSLAELHEIIGYNVCIDELLGGGE